LTSYTQLHSPSLHDALPIWAARVRDGCGEFIRESEAGWDSLSILLMLECAGNRTQTKSRSCIFERSDEVGGMGSPEEIKNPTLSHKTRQGWGTLRCGVMAGMSSCRSNCRRLFRIRMSRPRLESGFPGEGYFLAGGSCVE